MKGKQYDFVVTLKQPAFKIFDNISLLLCIIAIGIFSYLCIHETEKWWVCILAIAITLARIIYNFYQKKKNKKVTYTWAFIAVALAMVFISQTGFLNLLTGMLYLFAAFIEKQLKFPQQAGIDANGITFNNLFRRFYPWKNISNIVLKDGMLTVDYKNNKLIQKEIQEQVPAETEKEFNGFCQSNLQLLTVEH